MGEDRLHVVFGTGQVGRALAGYLAGRGLAIRAVSRRQPPALDEGVAWRAADVTDPQAARDAAKGASVVYQCLNAPYPQWPELFPPLQHGALAAAEDSGALLVSLENLYGYGPAGGRPMTEDLPLAATTVKGRIRAAMTGQLLAAADAAGSGSPSGGRRTSSARASPRDPCSASGSSATPSPAGEAGTYDGPWNAPTSPILLIGNTTDPSTPLHNAIAMTASSPTRGSSSCTATATPRSSTRAPARATT